MSSLDKLMRTCWWPLNDHWSVHLTSPHLPGFVWYGGLKAHWSFLRYASLGLNELLSRCCCSYENRCVIEAKPVLSTCEFILMERGECTKEPMLFFPRHLNELTRRQCMVYRKVDHWSFQNCNVIGFAGSEAKVAWLKELGFTHAFNYKTCDLNERLKTAAPDGANVYIDLVSYCYHCGIMA